MFRPTARSRAFFNALWWAPVRRACGLRKPLRPAGRPPRHPVHRVVVPDAVAHAGIDCTVGAGRGEGDAVRQAGEGRDAEPPWRKAPPCRYIAPNGVVRTLCRSWPARPRAADPGYMAGQPPLVCGRHVMYTRECSANRKLVQKPTDEILFTVPVAQSDRALVS
jgi:hypothetical protein